MSHDLRKPDFFIAGAAKSGTTSLWVYLKQHPDIFMPVKLVSKEPSYYCHGYGAIDHLDYCSIFRDAGPGQMAGEASTAYLTSPESPAWIKEDVPNAKIVIVLRNPVDRAYSLYRWMVNHGYESAYPFEKALSMESQRMNEASFVTSNPQYFYNYLYFHSGLYSEQVKRYQSAFPDAQLKIILFDDLKNKPDMVVKEVFAFLGVDDTFKPEIKVHNKAELKPALIGMHMALKGISDRHRHTRVDRVVSYLSRLNMKSLKLKWPKLAPETRQELLEKYRSDIRKTEALISQDLSVWLE
ncbi:MAG: sulfotransferase domain-containing protein [Mariprofundaceae bacterium]|nr:sulfotransferase domain-containing protein [Mariprofundaceae bacterium]